jgi:hypothetical protein
MTHLRAPLAVVLLVLLTLGAACLADLGAQTTQFGGEARAAAHERRRFKADGGTIAVQTDALRHHADVLLPQARLGTMLTLLGALHTCSDARLKLFVSHDRSPAATCVGLEACRKEGWAIFMPRKAAAFSDRRQ